MTNNLELLISINSKQIYSAPEIAILYTRQLSTVHRWTRNRFIRATMVGRFYVYVGCDLQEFDDNIHKNQGFCKMKSAKRKPSGTKSSLLIPDDAELTVLEIADRFNICGATVTNWCKRNELKATRIASRWIVKGSDLQKYFDSMTNI